MIVFGGGCRVIFCARTRRATSVAPVVSWAASDVFKGPSRGRSLVANRPAREESEDDESEQGHPESFPARLERRFSQDEIPEPEEQQREDSRSEDDPPEMGHFAAMDPKRDPRGNEKNEGEAEETQGRFHRKPGDTVAQP